MEAWCPPSPWRPTPNNAAISLWGKANGQQFAADWAAAFTAPITEELAKASGMVLLVLLAPRLIRTAFDGLIVGAFLGLGFQVFEDIIYGVNSAFGNFGVDSVASTYTTSVIRVVVGLTSHWTYSAIFCAGLIYLIGRPDEPRRVGRGLFLMVAAMALHGLWDRRSGGDQPDPVPAGLHPRAGVAHRSVRVDLQDVGGHRTPVDA